MEKISVKNTKDKGVTIKQLAEETGVTTDRLILQLKDAGIRVTDVEDLIDEKKKQKLLQHLRQQHHASEPSSEKVVLHRRTKAITLGKGSGSVNVQVRKRVYIKRPLVEEEVKEKVGSLAAKEESPLLSSVAEAPKMTSSEVSPLPKDEKEKSSMAAPTPPSVPVAAEGAPPPSSGKEEPKGEEVPKLDKRKILKQEESEEGASDRPRKKRKLRDNGRGGGDDRNLQAYLARGVDLGRVLKQSEEEVIDPFTRKLGKARGLSGKVKVHAFTKPTTPLVREVEIPESIKVGDLAQRMSVKASDVMKLLLKMGVITSINNPIDQDTAILVVEELGHVAKILKSDAIETALAQDFEVKGEKEPRPPVITIMGHVDHGKTTLLDYIRTTKVASSEAGGITQHIGAYHVETPKGTITFLDTPGHAAFTAMRARGAKLTDIVVLVVAADDGVMPQTIEAISHAKAANVPIVVAVNKMDKPGVDPEKIKVELSNHELIPEDWGGDTMIIPISAKTGAGVDKLLDSLLVQAELLELTAVTNCRASGVVIESRLDRGRGPVMTVLIQQGTLNKGDIILAGSSYGRIRALFNERGQAIEKAGPSIPVEALGLSMISQAGDDFIVVADEKRAREVATFRHTKNRESLMAKQPPKLEDLLQRIEDEKINVILPIVLKADVQGSVEALKKALVDISTGDAKVQVIASGIGGINESDVNLAIASKAIIVAFNVRANTEARKLIENNRVDVHYHNIIYDVIDQVKKAISGALAPEIQERLVGFAEVREVFRSSKTGTIAGCMVIEGIVKRNYPLRVLRDSVVVFEGVLESLRRFKEDISEARAGTECGISVKNYNDIKVGDQLEVFEKIEVKREIK